MNRTLLTLLIVSLTACAGASDDACRPGEVQVGVACVAVDAGSLPDSGSRFDAGSTSPDTGSASPDAGSTSPDVSVSAMEVCNGLDDDLDGETDEADPMLGESCGEAAGVCTVGMMVCTEGELACDGVSPSEEICNGLDDDCNGEVDEDTLQEFYLDEDGDGFGTGDACVACAPEECGEGMWVTMDGDCDETCDTCFPGATEVCDTRDNSCDGLIDEGVQTLLFVDSDGDGFGTGLSVPGCLDEAGDAPEDYALVGGDCGPEDPRAFPGGTAQTTPIEGPALTGAFDFNCDGETRFAYPRCESYTEPACQLTPSYCWVNLRAADLCGDYALRKPVSGTTVIPSVSDGTCRFTSETFVDYYIECS